MRLRILILFTMASICATAQTLERTIPERVGMSGARLAYADSAILNSINAGDIPGAVLAVVKDGKMAYLKAYGYRSIVPKREKMTTNTIFDMASCSKSMSTAICAMVLIEQGKLRLSDAVENFIPGFKNWTSADGKDHTTATSPNSYFRSASLRSGCRIKKQIRDKLPRQPYKLHCFMAQRF